MFERGYAQVVRYLSVKLSNGHFLTTPTGSSFGRLVAEELSVVDKDGKHLTGKPPLKRCLFT
nr:class II aldolase/adducin family protein [Pseudoalteromonas sp. WY3]